MGALKSKTMWFAAAVAIVGLIEQNSGLLRQLIGEHNFGLLMLGIGIVSAILRAVTTQPIEDKA